MLKYIPLGARWAGWVVLNTLSLSPTGYPLKLEWCNRQHPWLDHALVKLPMTEHLPYWCRVWMGMPGNLGRVPSLTLRCGGSVATSHVAIDPGQTIRLNQRDKCKTYSRYCFLNATLLSLYWTLLDLYDGHDSRLKHHHQSNIEGEQPGWIFKGAICKMLSHHLSGSSNALWLATMMAWKWASTTNWIKYYVKIVSILFESKEFVNDLFKSQSYQLWSPSSDSLVCSLLAIHPAHNTMLASMTKSC